MLMAQPHTAFGIHDFASGVSRSYFPYEIMRAEREEDFRGRVEMRNTPLATITRASANGSFSGRTLGGATSPVVVLHWALAGDLEFRRGDRSVNIKNGDIVLIDGDKPMHSEQRGAADAFALALPRQLLQARYPDYERWCFAPQPGRHGAGAMLRGMLKGLWAQSDALRQDGDQEIAILGCIVDLCGATFQRINESEALCGLARQYERVVSFIDRNLRDPNIDVGVAANQLGISRSYLHAAMSAAGTTFGRRLLARRLETAAAALEKSPGKPNITLLALSVGFRSTSHFSRSFSEHFGVAPSAYRFSRQRELARLIH